MEILTPEKIEILRAALRTWGSEAQLALAQEELAELVVKISHYRRARITAGRVSEEIADVQIMLWQMMEMPEFSGVATAIADKLNRLEIRIDDAEVKNVNA